MTDDPKNRWQIDTRDLTPLIDILEKNTHGPGEAGAICLALFILLWRTRYTEKTLEQVADDARNMILSYHASEDRTHNDR